MKKIKLSPLLVLLICCLTGIKSFAQSPAAGTATFTGVGTTINQTSTTGSANYVPTSGGITFGQGLEFTMKTSAAGNIAITSTTATSETINFTRTVTSIDITEARIRSAKTGSTSGTSTTLNSAGDPFWMESLNLLLINAGTVTLTFTGYNNGVAVSGATVSATCNSTTVKKAVTFPSAFNNVDDVVITGFGTGTGNTLGQTGIRVDDILVGISVPNISYSAPPTYTVGTAITNLTPTVVGGAVGTFGYSASTSTYATYSPSGQPYSLGTDAAGNLYSLDGTNNYVYETTYPGGVTSNIASPTSGAIGLAVDPSGYIYVTDNFAGTVLRYSNTGTTRTLLGTITGFSSPFALASDPLGYIYIVDGGTTSIKKIPPGITGTLALSSISNSTFASGFANPYGIAIDQSQNIYVSNYTSNTIDKIAAGTTTRTGMTITGTALNAPRNMSFDPAGNLYVANYGANTILKIVVSGTSGTSSNLITGLSSPRDVSVDPTGTMYIANSGGNAILKDVETGGYAISPTLPAGLSFSTSTGVISGTPTASSAATVYTVTGYNATGSGTATVTITVNPQITVANLTGPTASPIYYGTTGNILFGFTLTNTTASTITVNTFKLQASNAISSIFANGKLYKSTTSTTYPTGFSATAGSVAFNSADVTITGLTESIAAGTSVNYYLSGDFTGTGSVAGLVLLSIDNAHPLITSPSNYTTSNSILGTGFSLANVFNWRGNSNAWGTATSYVTADGVTVSAVAPGVNDIVKIGVIAYPGGSTQPIITANSSVKELLFGSNSSPTLTVNTGVTLTVADNLTINASSSPSLIGPGTIAVTNDLDNNGTTVTQTTAVVTVGGDINNAGTYKQTGTGTMTSTGDLNNTGTYQQTSTSSLSVGGNMQNSGTFSETSSGNIAVTGTLTTNALTSMTLGSTLCTFGGNITNGGTITEGTGGLTFSGTTFSNSGTFTANGPTILGGSFSNTGTFTPGTQSITYNGTGSGITLSTTSPITYTTLNITNTTGGTTTLSSGSFIISSTGTLTMSANSVLAAGGNLTLNSDATGSATVAAIPSSSSITGNVNVQRYFQGGGTQATNETYRTYRLISFPVNSNSITSNTTQTAYYNLAGLSYLYTGGPGGSTNGFTVANSGTSTVFTYREDTPPLATSFNSGNYKGVSNLLSDPFPVTSISGTYKLYTGGGLMVFYVGSAGGGTFSTKNPTYYPVPDNTTAVFTGTLNQGDNQVKLWYSGSTSFSYTGATTASGFYLVGNPYASTIDLTKFSNAASDPLTGFWGGAKMSKAFYIYDYQTKVFNSYTVGVGSSGGHATQYIASGQGFFAKATSAAGAVLVFHEAAKTAATNNPTGNNLLLGLPVAADPRQFLHLKVSQDATNYNEILVVFGPDTKNTYEGDIDIDYMKGIGNSISLSTFANASGIPLCINQMHSIDSLTRIKLNIGSTVTGLDTLSGTGFDKLDPRYDVYLVDHYKKDSTILNANSKYLFNINLADTTTFGSTRFELAFHKKASLANYKLLSFTATKVSSTLQAANTGILLTWTVQNEDKFTGFTIQRADGSLQFVSLYSLQSDGSGTYTYTDRTPLAGVNKYRLMQDGAFDQISYSETITIDPTTVTGTDTNPITLYPNPVANQLQISVGKNPPSQVHLTIMNTASGLVMISKDVSSTNIQENVSALFAGNYIVEISDITTKRVIGRKKFIKL